MRGGSNQLSMKQVIVFLLLKPAGPQAATSDQQSVGGEAP